MRSLEHFRLRSNRLKWETMMMESVMIVANEAVLIKMKSRLN